MTNVCYWGLYCI